MFYENITCVESHFSAFKLIKINNVTEKKSNFIIDSKFLVVALPN